MFSATAPTKQEGGEERRPVKVAGTCMVRPAHPHRFARNGESGGWHGGDAADATKILV